MDAVVEVLTRLQEWVALVWLIQPSGFRTGVKTYVAVIDDCTVYVVENNHVMTNYDMDFMAGGNGYRFDFIPKDEIWLASTLPDEEFRFTLFHELIERYLMQDFSYDYDKAHKIANFFERKLRAKEDIETGELLTNLVMV